ncbi:MAG: hypothetical protein A3D94_18455 [Alphaproteobacteria bacterium RIFCSPHIGHO2_12_FULL_66_14]|jgi:hypothetical protein|nr:MAG: hypothetical protein A3D94_18455 [Alphaproteobacteria bacterium RIFCSPHIGHO2_12_FULL_66_14]
MTALRLAGALAAAAACLSAGAFAQVGAQAPQAQVKMRAKADVACRPTSTALHYDCTIRLTNARTGEPLGGVTLTVGADMPSMPMMHSVRPVAAPPEPESGSYRARLALEMHGDWALQLNLSGPLRDRVVAIVRFEPGRAESRPGG